ncbi:uncharacterized protein BXZ73DRAFT_84252 [Epithele typhae]|uniref:uncharacterized protein n=1 Tax=Epithele typhae TaxID=378194 RepID=UPI002007837B|nr:uncharacterized protein BXZ73DRAFT_84252 [Epithele typhae]KAH9908815.1 hypothetical protein BXZ73DRAFT_84252 [Epithele typhae]
MVANRYYTAEVYSETYNVNRFWMLDAIGILAVIYVWGASEGVQAWRRPMQGKDQRSFDEDTGIPGLLHVIDAMGATMWPSLIHASRARDLIGWALEEASKGLYALMIHPRHAVRAPRHRPGRGQGGCGARGKAQEPDTTRDEGAPALARHRGSNDGAQVGRDEKAKAQEHQHEGQQHADEQKNEVAMDAEAQTWDESAPVSAMVGGHACVLVRSRNVVFPDIHIPSPFPRTGSDSGSDIFDNDFAIGADHLLDDRYDDGRVTPMPTGASYRLLGSVPDSGDGNDSMSVASGTYGALEDNDKDDDTLTRAGPQLHGDLAPTGAFAPAPGDLALLASTSAPTASATKPHPSTAKQRQASPSTRTTAKSRSWNFSCVFSVLQGMKDEIVGMGDKDERQRAAAHVALRVVYWWDRDRGQARAELPLVFKIPALIIERARPLLVNPQFYEIGVNYGNAAYANLPVPHEEPTPTAVTSGSSSAGFADKRLMV